MCNLEHSPHFSVNVTECAKCCLASKRRSFANIHSGARGTNTKGGVSYHSYGTTCLLQSRLISLAMVAVEADQKSWHCRGVHGCARHCRPAALLSYSVPSLLTQLPEAANDLPPLSSPSFPPAAAGPSPKVESGERSPGGIPQGDQRLPLEEVAVGRVDPPRVVVDSLNVEGICPVS